MNAHQLADTDFEPKSDWSKEWCSKESAIEREEYWIQRMRALWNCNPKRKYTDDYKKELDLLIADIIQLEKDMRDSR